MAEGMNTGAFTAAEFEEIRGLTQAGIPQTQAIGLVLGRRGSSPGAVQAPTGAPQQITPQALPPAQSVVPAPASGGIPAPGSAPAAPSLSGLVPPPSDRVLTFAPELGASAFQRTGPTETTLAKRSVVVPEDNLLGNPTRVSEVPIQANPAINVPQGLSGIWDGLTAMRQTPPVTAPHTGLRQVMPSPAGSRKGGGRGRRY